MCLAFIFRRFFVIKATTELQLQIQRYYFHFLMVYILLVTMIANGVLGTLKQILEHPPEIFSLLANTLPKFTHFYLMYMLVQCSTHAISATRYHVLFKYWFLTKVTTPQRAHELSEPEDQN